MRLKTRIQEWLADRIAWVQYPNVRQQMGYSPTLLDRWRSLSQAGKGWVLFAAFWGTLILLSIYGNTLP